MKKGHINLRVSLTMEGSTQTTLNKDNDNCHRTLDMV